MRIPIPKNKLVAFTLVGALLTVAVAGGLAFPIPGVTADHSGDDSGATQAATDAPTPNQDFTPAVQTQSGYGEEHEEHEEHEERGDDDEYEE